MRDLLREKLSMRGREEWLAEELAFYQDGNLYRRDPRTFYSRVKGAARLNRKELAILRVLAAWREEEARRRNKPKKRIVSDDKLIEVARRKPTSIERLRESRGFHRKFVERNGKIIVELVAEGLKVAKEDCPKRVNREGRDPELSLALDLLDTFLKTRAKELDMSPAYLASRGDLYNLLKSRAEGKDAPSDLRILRGWRRELVGDDLLGLLAGKYRLSLDPAGMGVVIHQVEDAG